MATERLQLILDASQAPQGASEWNAATSQVMSSALRTNSALETMQGGIDGAVGGLKMLAATYVTMETARHAKDVLELGARYQTLGVVMNVVGRNANYGAGEMRGFEQSLEKTGISMLESRKNLAALAAAQIDLSKSSAAARVAQDLATQGGLNSSEAFERMVQAVVSGQPRILHTMQLFADFNGAERKWADQHNRSAESLTQVEKVNIRFNAVLEEGAKRAGAYEAAMGTAGKQLKSSERYWEDLKVKVSQAFQPEFTKAVFAYAEALKYLGDHAGTVASGIRVLLEVGEVIAIAYGSRYLQSMSRAGDATATMYLQVARGNAVLLDSVAAERGAAEASVQRAMAQRQSSAQVVAALEAERAEIRALQVAERQRLATSTNPANYVPGQAPLGQAQAARDQNAVTLAMRERAAAQTNLIALSQKAAVSDAELAGAARAVAVADAEVIAAEKARAVVMASTTVATQAAAVATGAFSKALAFVGGPIGAVIIAGMALLQWLDHYEDGMVKAAEQTDAQRLATEKALDTERKRNFQAKQDAEELDRHLQKYKAMLEARQEELGKLTALNAHYRDSESSLKALEIRYDAMIQKSNDAKEHKGEELKALNRVTDAIAAQKIAAEKLAESLKLEQQVRDAKDTTASSQRGAEQELQLIGLTAEAAERKRIVFERVNALEEAAVTLRNALLRADTAQAAVARTVYDETVKQITANEQLAVARLHASEALGTQALRDKVDAMKLENDALRQGEATRATYLINRRYEQDVTKALRLSTLEEIAARVTLLQAERDEALATLTLTQAQTAHKKSVHELAVEERDLHKALNEISSALEKDLLKAVDEFSQHGITSFKSFFQEVQQGAITMVAQLDSALEKLSQRLDKAYEDNDGALIDSIEATMAKYEKLRQVAGIVSAITMGGTAGYTLGSSTGSSAVGALGGAASGAASGFMVAGPLGAAIGGLSGVVGGLMGAAHAHQEAARKLQEAADAFKMKETAFLSAATGSSVSQQLQAVQNNYDTLIKELNALAASGKNYSGVGGYDNYLNRYGALSTSRDAQLQKVTDDFWASIAQQVNALNGPLGALQNSLDDVTKRYTENIANAKALGATNEQLDAIEKLRVDQENALYAAAERQAKRDLDDLRIRQLQAAGKDDEVNAMKRQMEMEDALADKKSAAYIAMLQETQALEAEADAKAKAAQAAKDAAAAADALAQRQASLTEQFLRLTGQVAAADDAALAEQQRQQMKQANDAGASPTELAQLAVVQLFQTAQLHVQHTLDEQTKLQQAQLDTTKQQLDTQRQAVADSQRVLDALDTYSKSLVVGNLSPLSPLDQLREAKSQLDQQYAAAMGGDKTAAQGLPGAANTYLGLLRQDYASTAPYGAGFADVQRMVASLQERFGAQKTVEEQMLDALQKQADLQQQQLDALKDASRVAADTKAAVIAELEHQRDSALDINGLVIAQFGALRDTLTGVGAQLASAERDTLVANQTAIQQATQAEIDAIMQGASLQHVGILDQIRQAETTKTAQDQYYAQQLAATAKLYGWDSPQVQSIHDMQDEYDHKTDEQISVLKHQVDVLNQQLGVQQNATRLAYVNTLLANAAKQGPVQDAEGHYISPVNMAIGAIKDLFPGLIVALDEHLQAYIANADFRSPADYYTAMYANTDKSEVPDNVRAILHNAGVPGYANGGTTDGGWFTAGERGPELIYTPGAAGVLTSTTTSNLVTDTAAAASILKSIEQILTGMRADARTTGQTTAKRIGDLGNAFDQLVQLKRFENRDSN